MNDLHTQIDQANRRMFAQLNNEMWLQLTSGPLPIREDGAAEYAYAEAHTVAWVNGNVVSETAEFFPQPDAVPPF